VHRRRLIVAALALALAAAGCGRREATTADAPPPALAGSGPPVDFSFENAALFGAPLTSAAVRGRPAVIALLATYDLASQAQAKFLAQSIAHARGRVRAVAVLLDPPENRPLAAAFGAALGLTFPIAVADRATIAGRGAFGPLHEVPSLIVLDSEGRVAWQRTALTKDDELDAVIDRVR
jgi:hypothetical protein